MRANEKIKNRRLQLGISEIEAAQKSGLSIGSYWHVESRDDEVFEVPHIKNLKQLFSVLELDPFEVFELECAFCSGAPFLQEYLLPRSEIVRRHRLAKGWSREELGDKIGFYTVAIEAIETDAEYLDSWCVNLVREFASILDVPSQILLGIKCSRHPDVVSV
jgi:transcriptional regulator with XRE-family HTH domain